MTHGAANADPDATRAATRDAVERFLAALNAGDPDRIAACVTDDINTEHTTTLGHSLRGRDAYRERLPRFLGQFTDLRYDLEDLVVDGERAAAAYRMSCRWLDDGGTAHPVTIRGVFRFRVADGAIAHRIDYWDSGEFQRQVALAPTSATTSPASSTGEP
ncbi:MAG: nuclear transport factor 2 family protein [Acidimicrobiales bacterium]|nr:nuclear transport factor 2 family protein [Acidimicrobiales bacterium]